MNVTHGVGRIDLLACPFCGEAGARIASNDIGDFFVICGDGDEVGCSARTSDIRCESRAMAARRWNRRAARARPSGGDAEREALAKRLETDAAMNEEVPIQSHLWETAKLERTAAAALRSTKGDVR